MLIVVLPVIFSFIKFTLYYCYELLLNISYLSTFWDSVKFSF